MIDNESGKATRVNLWPLTLEGILRAGERLDRGLGMGWLMGQLVEAARRLSPEFEPGADAPALGRYALSPRPVEPSPTRRKGPFKARWRRIQDHDEEDPADDGSL